VRRRRNGALLILARVDGHRQGRRPPALLRQRLHQGPRLLRLGLIVGVLYFVVYIAIIVPWLSFLNI
jgi:hypothetical protein